MRTGAFAECALVSEFDAAHKPATLSFDEAAAPLAAWQALVDVACLSSPARRS